MQHISTASNLSVAGVELKWSGKEPFPFYDDDVLGWVSQYSARLHNLLLDLEERVVRCNQYSHPPKALHTRSYTMNRFGMGGWHVVLRLPFTIPTVLCATTKKVARREGDKNLAERSSRQPLSVSLDAYRDGEWDTYSTYPIGVVKVSNSFSFLKFLIKTNERMCKGAERRFSFVNLALITAPLHHQFGVMKNSSALRTHAR